MFKLAMMNKEKVGCNRGCYDMVESSRRERMRLSDECVVLGKLVLELAFGDAKLLVFFRDKKNKQGQG